jgi:hypothetical protein
MMWKAGYLDLDTQTQKGTLNELFGVSVKDDPAKVRGKRLHYICIEEFGSFRNVLELYNIMIPSIREGDIAYGFLYAVGTAGDKDSDFQGAQELVYNPRGYFMLPLTNVWDFEGRGRNEVTYFFSSYMSRLSCYDKDGNSDVTKALLEVLSNRYRVKYNSTDINSITKTIAEMPITPQEAILRTRSNFFPVTALNERIVQLDNNPNEFDDVYTGELFLNSKKEVEFLINHDTPIRDYPLKDNTNNKGCIEIFEMPEKDKNDKVYQDRYIIGYDPANNDDANSVSLISILVLDLWTDRLVAEYTGRPTYVDDGHEIARLMSLYYNAKIYYENNIKGCFGYFQKLQCLHLLADVPQYLKDKQLIKYSTFGNASKGIAATNPINNFANDRIREWLIREVPYTKMEDGKEVETTVPNLSFVRNRALLKELALYNPDINVDRVRALGMAMLGREEKVILYQGDIKGRQAKRNTTTLVDDGFFSRNYDERIANANWDMITQ